MPVRQCASVPFHHPTIRPSTLTPIGDWGETPILGKLTGIGEKALSWHFFARFARWRHVEPQYRADALAAKPSPREILP